VTFLLRERVEIECPSTFETSFRSDKSKLDTDLKNNQSTMVPKNKLPGYLTKNVRLL